MEMWTKRHIVCASVSSLTTAILLLNTYGTVIMYSMQIRQNTEQSDNIDYRAARHSHMLFDETARKYSNKTK